MTTTVLEAKNVEISMSEFEEHEPNEETIAAFREAEHPECLKSYSSIEEMFIDLGINVKR